jgi:hypothetical protein
MCKRNKEIGEKAGKYEDVPIWSLLEVLFKGREDKEPANKRKTRKKKFGQEYSFGDTTAPMKDHPLAHVFVEKM